jgi:uncharacterized membrane protein
LGALITLGVLVVLAFPIVSLIALGLGAGIRGRLRVLETRLARIEAAGGAAAGMHQLAERVSRLEASARPTAPDATPRGRPEAPGAPGPTAPETGAPPPSTAAPATPAAPERTTAASPRAPGHEAPLEETSDEAVRFDERAMVRPTPPPTAPPPHAARAAPPGPSLEERFGTRWVVWVGGVALGLGGIFLVRYSIEQGLLGPGMRVLLGALLGVGLVVGGEWLRRQERRTGLVGLPAAHIPSILTAAGTTVAYATAYAAFALYGFLGPAAAFLLLGVVALATLGAALLHGPALAALGLVGARSRRFWSPPMSQTTGRFTSISRW